MTLVLAAATAAEMRAALRGLEDRETVADVPARGSARARLAGREALLVVTGVGPVNAALEMGWALGRFDVSGIVNIGVAGSYDLESAPLGSAMAACAEVYPEYGVAGDDGLADDEAFPFPQWEGRGLRVSRRIELDPDLAAEALGLALPKGMRRGTFLTVAGVTGTKDRALALASRHGAMAESMEGFALALAAASRDVPYVEVRTVSNAVGERDRAKWTLTEALAGLGAALAGMLARRGVRG